MVDLNKLNYVRLEFKDGTSNKFWSLVKDSSGNWGATYGKIGATSTQSTEYTHSVAQKKVNEKIAKGYKVATDLDKDKGPSSKKKEVPVDFKKLMEEL